MSEFIFSAKNGRYKAFFRNIFAIRSAKVLKIESGMKTKNIMLINFDDIFIKGGMPRNKPEKYFEIMGKKLQKLYKCHKFNLKKISTLLIFNSSKVNSRDLLKYSREVKVKAARGETIVRLINHSLIFDSSIYSLIMLRSHIQKPGTTVFFNLNTLDKKVAAILSESDCIGIKVTSKKTPCSEIKFSGKELSDYFSQTIKKTINGATKKKKSSAIKLGNKYDNKSISNLTNKEKIINSSESNEENKDNIHVFTQQMNQTIKKSNKKKQLKPNTIMSGNGIITINNNIPQVLPSVIESKNVPLADVNEDNDVKTNISKKPNQKTKRIITFTHDDIKEEWIISISDSEIDLTPVSFKNSLGIMFLLLLHKYYSLPNTVHSADLYVLAKKWQNKSKIINELTDNSNKISEAIRYDFRNKIPELNFIREHIKIKKDKSYFIAAPEASKFELSIKVVPPLPETPNELQSWSIQSKF